MRRFALGRLLYSPERFGLMLVGDFMDVMAGYNEGEIERMKGIAEIVRTSTTILWNIQVDKEHRLLPEKLWPFAWEPGMEAEPDQVEILSEEDLKRKMDKMEEIFNTIGQNGNSNIKS